MAFILGRGHRTTGHNISVYLKAEDVKGGDPPPQLRVLAGGLWGESSLEVSFEGRVCMCVGGLGNTETSH